MRKKPKYSVNFKHLFEHGVSIECDDLEKFIETMDSAIKAKQGEFTSFVARQVEGKSADQQAEIYDWYSDENAEVYQTFPQHLWHAVFTSLFSLFEQEMNSYCRRVRSFAKLKSIPLTSIPSGSGVLLPGQKCLQSCGIRLAVKSKEWKRFQAYVGIRNLIVHNRGRLRSKDDESARVKTVARRAKHINIDNFDRIVLEREFCDEVLEVTRTLLLKTLKAIPQKLLRR